MSTADVINELVKERIRQDARWGEQNHHDLGHWDRGLDPAAIVRCFGMPTAEAARTTCESKAKEPGALGYADIAIEEVAEAIEAAAQGDEEALRKELVQCAAVFVAWVECIDRRRARKAVGP